MHGSVNGAEEIEGLPQSLELGTKIEIHLFISHQNDSGVSGDIFLNHMTVACVCVCVITESWMMVCEQRLFLGQFLSAPEDHWLSFHFYSSCLEKEQEGCTRPAIEARACMAKLLLLQGGTTTHIKISVKIHSSHMNTERQYLKTNTLFLF